MGSGEKVVDGGMVWRWTWFPPHVLKMSLWFVALFNSGSHQNKASSVKPGVSCGKWEARECLLGSIPELIITVLPSRLTLFTCEVVCQPKMSEHHRKILICCLQTVFNVVHVPKRWASFYVFDLTASQIWWKTMRLSSVGLSSSVVGKYLAFVLICWLQQMDGVYQRGQEKAARLEERVSWGWYIHTYIQSHEWNLSQMTKWDSSICFSFYFHVDDNRWLLSSFWLVNPKSWHLNLFFFLAMKETDR